MSAILSSETLNDFIAPSVACIKPVELLPSAVTSSEPTVTREDAAPDAKTAAQISLTDCLACSGCVTSSEAVLIQLQSHTEVLDALQRFPGRRFIALLSPQTRAALAVAVGVTDEEAGNMVSQLLCGEAGGFEAVLDTNVFRRITRYYGAREVLDGPEECSGKCGGKCSGKKEEEKQKKPILASSCPGWICYLESTHPELIPHLSRLKSPQAIGGTFVKSVLLGSDAVRSPEDVYVVSIMPCFDKKLEGARGELTSTAWLSGQENKIRDVDCVITTRELLSFAEARGMDFRSLPRTPPPAPQLLEYADGIISKFLTAGGDGNGSKEAGSGGGQMAYILSTFLRRHEGSGLQVQPGRNSDTIDYVVVSAAGETIAKLSRCYGFRNIQNLVRRLKPVQPKMLPKFGSTKISNGAANGTTGAARKPVLRRPEKKREVPAVYVEVMACPGGCTNGGGQIKYDDESIWAEPLKPTSQKELLALVDEAYYSDEEAGAAAPETPQLLHGGVGGVSAAAAEEEEIESVMKIWEQLAGVGKDQLLYTTYRRVANDLGKRLGDADVLEMASRSGGGW